MMSQIYDHTEDNDNKGRINENSLQHKTVTILKCLQDNVFFLAGKWGADS